MAERGLYWDEKVIITDKTPSNPVLGKNIELQRDLDEKMRKSAAEVAPLLYDDDRR